MDAEKIVIPKEKIRLSTGQQAEIGNIMLSARRVSRQTIAQAQAKADEILKNANERADELVRDAASKAAETLRLAEEQAARIVHDAEARANEIAPAEEKAEADESGRTSALSEDMQEYVVRCVGECFARLRQQQMETADFISEQWRRFLSELSLPELPAPGSAPAEAERDDVSQQEIEERVSTIAKELMEIIGK